MTDHHPSRFIGCIALSLAALLLSACSSEARPKVEYALPDTLCGSDVGKNIVEPFFPPGSKLMKTGDSFDNGTYASSCTYVVDGSPTLIVSYFFHESTSSARQIATQRAARYSDGDAKGAVDIVDDIALYPRGAVAVEQCPGYPSDTDGLPRDNFSVEIMAYYPKDLSKEEKALAQLVKKIIPVVAKANGC